ncbi:MAG: hypothetical protein R3F43_20575 [bacterium]
MVAAELAHWYGRHDAQVLLNPVFAPSAAPSSATAGALVFVGHGFSRKGLDHAFAALVHLPGVSLHVVGADGHAARWRARARRLGLSNRLIFHGEVEAAPHRRGRRPGAPGPVRALWQRGRGGAGGRGARRRQPATGAACLLHPDHIWDPTSGPRAWPAACASPSTRPDRPSPRRRPRPPTSTPCWPWWRGEDHRAQHRLPGRRDLHRAARGQPAGGGATPSIS